MHVVIKVLIFCFLRNFASTSATGAKKALLVRLLDSMVRNDNDEEGFTKERGVRGQCLYTYLELDSKSTKEAVRVVHDLAGWEDLITADSRYAALDEAYNKRNDEVKVDFDPLEESKGLTDLKPVNKKIIEIKEYQREMMKAMLEMVKWSEKKQNAIYFLQLDPVGKSELPCVKAIQESYASKYPDLLHSNTTTNDVITDTKDKLEDSKRNLEEMISKYMKMIDNLETAEEAIPEIKTTLVREGWKLPNIIQES